MVRKSDQRNLRRPTVAYRPCARTRRPTSSDNSLSTSRTRSRSRQSSGKVYSRDKLFSTDSGSTSRESSPKASACRWAAKLSPSMRPSVSRSTLWISLTVRSPRRSSVSRVTEPTPQSAPTFSPPSHRTTSSRASGITKRPSGLACSLASLARNLLWATPTDAVRPTSARIAARICSAIRGPSPNSRREPVTSTNASSIDTGSIIGENRSKMAKTRCEASAYRAMSPRTKIPCGQRRYASRDGMAEWMPNTRAS
ncbi:MAG: hypothetical protein BWX70_03473 [Verrucomicrobia bacterium ADurb.Bin070]|nr:MAG: hypothetical protein BWX70_03473 [Verrucomicrobia bacterium ADurb.Bin070]